MKDPLGRSEYWPLRGKLTRLIDCRYYKLDTYEQNV